MGTHKIAMALAAVAVLGSVPAMAAAPVTPSVAKISSLPAFGANLGTHARIGARKATGSSAMASAEGIGLGILGAGAAGAGIYAGLHKSGHDEDFSVSP